MSINEITDKVNTLGSAWEQFKKVNDTRLREIEKKGNADPLLVEHLSRIGNVLDNQKTRLDMMETAANRPARENKMFKHEGNVSENKKAFEAYIRKGLVGEVEAFEKKALSVGSDPDGGYLVTPTLSQQISKYVLEISPMRQLASVEEISSDSLDIIIDNDSAAGDWVAETATRSDTTTPQMQKKSIVAYELYAQPKATQKLVDDSAIDIEAWLAEKIGDIFASKENTAFISGDGSGKPKGILAYAAGTSYGQVQQLTSGTSAAVTADGLVKLYYGLKSEYAKNATFLMNLSVAQAVRLLKDTTGQYIWQPGLALGTPDTLIGVPVKITSDMPDAAANSLSVAIGDFKRAYKIVDRVGTRILRDPFTDKPFVKFYATKRVGGEVVNFEAIKLLKLAV
jgi:HK97 family phage major capsid protein